MKRAAIAVLACAVTAHAETRPDYGGTLEAALLGAPVALDPVTAQSHAEITVVGLVFDTLYTIDLDGTVEPHLAIGLPELDAARTTAHIALRRGVAFHDATLMTAGDVAASLERARTTAGWVLAPVAAVRASGDGVDLVLRAPVADLAALLALPQTAITRRGKPPTAGRPIGSGPFAVDSFDPANKRLVLKAFDDHFAGRGYLDQLVLGWFDTPDGEARAFETGQAQLSARGVAAFARTSSSTPPPPSVQGSVALLMFLGFGKQHAQVTGDRGFRAALDLALDRGALELVTSGELTRGTRLPLPIEAGGAVLDPAALAGDAAAARAQLGDAGKRSPALAPASLAGVKLTIVVDQTRPDDHAIALAVSRGLGKLGIDFTIDAVGADKLRERVARGDCDLWIGQLAAPITVATAWWGAAFAAGNDGWVQARLASGGIPADVARQFASHLPIIPLMFRSLLIWHTTDVHGLRFDASGRPGLADLYRLKPAAKARPKARP